MNPVPFELQAQGIGMSQLLLLGVVGLVAWWWWDAARARETAVDAARRACRQFRVQFLDDSVVLRWQRPGRDREGRLRLGRLYIFEFTREGSARHVGYARMLGQHVVDVHLDAVEDAAPGESRERTLTP